MISFLNLLIKFIIKLVNRRQHQKLKKNIENFEVILLNREIPEQILDIQKFLHVILILNIILIKMKKKQELKLMKEIKNSNNYILKHLLKFQIERNNKKIK